MRSMIPIRSGSLGLSLLGSATVSDSNRLGTSQVLEIGVVGHGASEASQGGTH
jgi:hypothetical protein